MNATQLKPLFQVNILKILTIFKILYTRIHSVYFVYELKPVQQWKIIADKWNRFTFLFWRQRSKGR